MNEMLLREYRKLLEELQYEKGLQVGDTAEGMEISIRMVKAKIKKIEEWGKY